MKRGICFTLAGILSAAVIGCETETATTTPGTGTPATTPAASTDAGGGDVPAPGASQGKTATAILQPSKAPGQDNVTGTVTFTEAENGVRVQARVTGLTPNSQHGFHVHEKGDLSAPDLSSAGGHFNPTGETHGGPDTEKRHGGDLGNLKADAEGNAVYDQVIPDLTIDDPKTGVVGKSVIVHATADDLKTDPAGNSGARIAGGIIKQ